MQTIKDINELAIPTRYKNFILETLHAIKDIPTIEDVILFGSCARGIVKERSDIDLAFITSTSLSWDEESKYTDRIPSIESENFVDMDFLFIPKELFVTHKDTIGMVQRPIHREGVSIIGLIRPSVMLV